jgi:hypothetical protein
MHVFEKQLEEAKKEFTIVDAPDGIITRTIERETEVIINNRLWRKLEISESAILMTCDDGLTYAFQYSNI